MVIGPGREPSWTQLLPKEFDDHMAWLSQKIEKAGRDRVISMEFAFSPPKSYSVAALAGSVPNLRLLELHLRAVDAALELVSNYLFIRD